MTTQEKNLGQFLNTFCDNHIHGKAPLTKLLIKVKLFLQFFNGVFVATIPI